eukprot:gnl/TRDRNA2_/TRDRNA2_174805_c2_seq20.p1 gnl/TRDRNA2_/TRDRNA2_174805_c2~~gnl/TRDRNA2_/TRDRNA2_174805_c2_seq20.p1  ORF type:complete len:451 (+),score=42.10 gnl/TRDRNA2_/TRDRNA2_174805_c2_seq20:106-1458(+)
MNACVVLTVVFSSPFLGRGDDPVVFERKLASDYSPTTNTPKCIAYSVSSGTNAQTCNVADAAQKISMTGSLALGVLTGFKLLQHTATSRCLDAPASQPPEVLWPSPVSFQQCLDHSGESFTGRQMWKSYDLSSPDANGFKIWRVQRNQANNAAATNSNMAAQIHCLQYKPDSNQLQINPDCQSVDHATMLFRLTTSTTAVALNDDPEVTNVKGEHFKIDTKGCMTLIHLPRYKSLSEALLVMVAEISELSGTHHNHHGPRRCVRTYMRNLLITGTALGELSALTFHARNKTAPFLMGFGNKLLWLPDGRITTAVVAEYIKLLNLHTNVSIEITPDEKRVGSPKAIHVKIDAINVTVSRPHVAEGKNWQFFNLQVQGLDSGQYLFRDIGGVLGSDSPPKKQQKWTCVSARRLLQIRRDRLHHQSLAEHPVDDPVFALKEVGIDSDAALETD